MPCAYRLQHVLLLELAIMSSAGCTDAPAKHETTAAPSLDETTASTWEPLAPDASFDGMTLQEWAIGWMRWYAAANSCVMPLFDDDGSKCALYQPDDEGIFYFQLGAAPTVRKRCVVPEGHGIVVPLEGFFIDNVGRDVSVDATQLKNEADAAQASIRDLALRYDGHEPDRSLDEWLVTPIESSYVLPPPDNIYTCSSPPVQAQGEIKPAFVGGAFVVFPPPEKGSTHTIEYGGTITTSFGAEDRSYVTSTFTVE